MSRHTLRLGLWPRPTAQVLRNSNADYRSISILTEWDNLRTAGDGWVTGQDVRQDNNVWMQRMALHREGRIS